MGIGLPSTVDVPGVKAGLNTVVYPDAGLGTDAAVQPTSDGGVRALVVLKDARASHEQRFALSLPSDVEAVENGDGGFDLVRYTPGKTTLSVGEIEAPWARDANGRPLDTRYRTDGNTLVQTIDTKKDTAFPVVADPKIKKNWAGVNIYFNKSETRRLGNGTTVGGIALGPLTGGLSAGILGIGGVLISERAASGQCLGVRFSWSSLVTKSPERSWWFKCSKYKSL